MLAGFFPGMRVCRLCAARSIAGRVLSNSAALAFQPDRLRLALPAFEVLLRVWLELGCGGL